MKRSLLRKLNRTEIVPFCPCLFLLHHLYRFSDRRSISEPDPVPADLVVPGEESPFPAGRGRVSHGKETFSGRERLSLEDPAAEKHKEVRDLPGLSHAPFRAVLCGEKWSTLHILSPLTSGRREAKGQFWLDLAQARALIRTLHEQSDHQKQHIGPLYANMYIYHETSLRKWTVAPHV